MSFRGFPEERPWGWPSPKYTSITRGELRACWWDGCLSAMHSICPLEKKWTCYKSLCVQCTVRPIKLKHRSLGQRKAYCRAKQGKWVAYAQKSRTPQWFGVKILWSEGCRVCDFFRLVGGEVTGQGSRKGSRKIHSTWSCHPLPWFCAYMLSHFSHVWLFATLWIIAHQAPLSMGFSQQE